MSNVNYFYEETLFGQRVIGTYRDRIYVSGDIVTENVKELRILRRQKYSNEAWKTFFKIPFHFAERICMPNRGAHGVYTISAGFVFALAYGQLEEELTVPAALYLFYINARNGCWDVQRLQNSGEHQFCAHCCGAALHVVSRTKGRLELLAFNTRIHLLLADIIYLNPITAFANIELDTADHSNTKITSGYLDLNVLQRRLDSVGERKITLYIAPVRFAAGLPIEWALLSPKFRLFISTGSQQLVQLSGIKYKDDALVISKAEGASNISLHVDSIPHDGYAHLQLVEHACAYNANYKRFIVHTIEWDMTTAQFRLAPRRISQICKRLVVEAEPERDAVQVIGDAIYAVQKTNILTVALNVPTLYNLAQIACQKYCQIYSK